ncbi:hypothetical protein DLJ53_19175 [Acuticoccus sediminis]|uniref:Uncharacterized protein n=1 Tax=Acuticoccus sediminis TaxID=2184697 RepID=A0A8B2NNM7_9HYPH|nr:hypothetical protein [Acuticoccus sediminis]RAH99868.1 hypothetical protein DLJ53_19175 [Acuticoccus sediminis]
MDKDMAEACRRASDMIANASNKNLQQGRVMATIHEQSAAYFDVARAAEAEVGRHLIAAYEALHRVLEAVDTERRMVWTHCLAEGKPYAPAAGAEHMEIRLTHAEHPLREALAGVLGDCWQDHLAVEGRGK